MTWFSCHHPCSRGHAWPFKSKPAVGDEIFNQALKYFCTRWAQLEELEFSNVKSSLFILFTSLWFGRRGHSGGISTSLLKKTRAMIDANRVIRLYLKGVVDSQSIKVKRAPLVTVWFIIARSRRATSCTKRGACVCVGGRVWARETKPPPFVLISPDVTCKAHFGNYPWKISMSRSIVVKWFKGAEPGRI